MRIFCSDITDIARITVLTLPNNSLIFLKKYPFTSIETPSLILLLHNKVEGKNGIYPNLTSLFLLFFVDLPNTKSLISKPTPNIFYTNFVLYIYFWYN